MRDLFNRRVHVSQAPELNTTHRVLSRGLEIAQKVKRDCQGTVGSVGFKAVNDSVRSGCRRLQQGSQRFIVRRPIKQAQHAKN